MFGYVRPWKDTLTVRDYRTYRAAYCGLCRAMSRRFGFRARFLVNYDMTFLYLLRSAAEPAAEQARCRCPARICGRELCIRDDSGYACVTACNLILSWHKLRDGIRDSGLLRSIPYRLACLLLRRPYRKAVRLLPDFDALARAELDRLAGMESADSPSIDATADTFARITAGCAADIGEPEVRRPMESVLYQVGRFIYLTDALDDLSKDCRSGAYNPLRFRFRPTEGRLKEEDLEYLSGLIDGTVNLAGAALGLLPIRSYGPLLENIVYLGLPAVFTAVRQGSFHHRKKDHPRKERFE